jgi:hypothetical protein
MVRLHSVGRQSSAGKMPAARSQSRYCAFAKNRRNGYKSSSLRNLAMFGLRKRNREQHRYYLLPGMGKCNKRRYKQWVRRSFIVGIIVSAIFGYLIYHFNRY